MNKVKKQELDQMNFYECRERYAVTQWFDMHVKPKHKDDFDVSLHLTSTIRDARNICNYDAVMYFRNKLTKNIEYKFIVEVKFRDGDYETLMLEKSKYKSLMADYNNACKYKPKEENISVLYVNFTTSGTYVYNLTNDKINAYINDKKNKVVEKHVKTTYVSDDCIVEKNITYLPKEMAKKYDYVLNGDYRLIYEIANTPKEIYKREIVKSHYNLF